MGQLNKIERFVKISTEIKFYEHKVKQFQTKIKKLKIILKKL